MAGALAAAHRRRHRPSRPEAGQRDPDPERREAARLRGREAAVGASLVEGDGTTEQPLTDEGTIAGTLQYMAPEQLEGHEADARSDIFALGCVLFEAATGKRAFEARSKATLIAKIIQSEPTAWDTAGVAAPPGLGPLIRTCLAKSPDQRWQSAQDIALGLQRIADERSAKATGRDRQFASSRIWIYGLATILIAAVAAVLAASVWPSTSRSNAASRALRYHAAGRPGVRLARLAGDSARRAAGGILRAVRWPARAVGANAGRRGRAAPRHGRGGVCVLVARQPRDRVLRRRQIEKS